MSFLILIHLLQLAGEKPFKDAEGFALTSGTVTQDEQLEPDSVPSVMFFLWEHPCTVPCREGGGEVAGGSGNPGPKFQVDPGVGAKGAS